MNKIFENVNDVSFASVMNKVDLYNRREYTAMGHGSRMNEAFRARWKHNQDIYFNLEERKAVTDMFGIILKHIKEEYDAELSCYYTIMLNEECIINEGFMDVFKKIKDKTANVANKVKDEFKQGVKDVKTWAEDKIEKTKLKYQAAIEFINNLIKAGIKSVKSLITAIGNLLGKLADTISGALEKLGMFNDPDEGEEEAKADIKIDAAYEADIPEKQKSFFEHVVAYITTMSGTGKAETLMKESFDFDCDGTAQSINEGLIDTVANNKFIQFILCYGKDKKISWWKSLIISLVGSFIISVVLPVALTALGTSAGAISTICAAVAMVWQCKGILKILLNRYVNKKPGQKFFDFPTTLSLVLCIVPMALMKIPAVNQWLQDQFMKLMEHFKVVIEKVGEAFQKFFELIRLKSPDWIVKTTENIKDVVVKLGGTVHFKGSIADQRSATANVLSEQGVEKSYVDNIINAMKACDGAKTSLGMHKDFNSFYSALGVNNRISAMTFDTSKWGGNTQFANFIEGLMKSGKISGTLSNVCGQTLHDSSKGMAGAFPILIGCTESDYNTIMAEAAKAGIKHGVLKYFPGKEAVGKVTELVTNISKPAIDWLANLHFNPVFVPCLDSKKWGDYRISFGSEEAGFKAYKVSEVKEMKLKDVEALDSDNPAVQKLIMHLKDVQSKHKELIDAAEKRVEEVNESKKSKKLHDVATDVDYTEDKPGQIIPYDKFIVDDPKKLPDVWQEHGVVVINKSKNLPATIDKKDLAEIENGGSNEEHEEFIDDEKEKFEKNGNIEDADVIVIFVDVPVKDKNGKKKILEKQPGVVIDMTTMMCADLAPFAKKRRKSPYFLKGLFGKLSFSPTTKNDNEMKAYIHHMLATTFETACKSCVANGTGNFYIIQDEKKKFVPMPSARGEMFDLGNLTPAELCEVLNNIKEGKDNEKAYELLSGKYTTDLTFTKSGKKRAIKSTNTRETAKYTINSNGEFVRDKNGQYDYVDVKVIPEICDKNGEIYKQFKENKKIKKLFFKQDGENINVDMLVDPVLNIKKYLFRPETTFSSEDKDKFIKSIRKYKKEHEDTKWYQRVNDFFDSDSELYDAFKEAVEIIWDELGSKNIKDYISIRKKIAKATNEGYFMNFDSFIDNVINEDLGDEILAKIGFGDEDEDDADNIDIDEVETEDIFEDRDDIID